jgi:hypothetical protein
MPAPHGRIYTYTHTYIHTHTCQVQGRQLLLQQHQDARSAQIWDEAKRLCEEIDRRQTMHTQNPEDASRYAAQAAQRVRRDVQVNG